MKEFKYVITDELGLHARPAGLLVKEASKFNCKIRLQKGDREVEAKSILGVMALGTKKGDEIRLTFDGTDEEEAFNIVGDFIRNNL